MEDNKKKLTLYLNEDVIKAIKVIAIQEDISLSQLTEKLYKEVLNNKNK